MWTKLLIAILFVVSGFQSRTIESVSSNFRAPQVESIAQKRIPPEASSRHFVGLRKINPIRAILSRPRVSPLYLINGTVCRLINFQPVCTTLSTTGLAVGGSPSGGAPAPARSSGGSSSSASGSGGGNAGGSGGGGTGGGSSGARPSSSGVTSGGSSVQFANQPSRVSALAQNEQPGVYVERTEPTETVNTFRSQPVREIYTSNQPLGVLVAKRPLRLLQFRRPTQAPKISPQARQSVNRQVSEIGERVLNESLASSWVPT